MIGTARIRRHLRNFAAVMMLLVGIAACSSVGNTLQAAPFAAHRILISGSATASGYLITDLGTLPGDNTSEVGLQNLGGTLNNLAQAAGASSHGAWVAALFSNGNVTNLNTLGFDVSLGTAINRSGQVVGWGFRSSDPTFHPYAFLYSNGRMKDISSPSLFPTGNIAFGINSSGQVVGQGYLTSSTYHAFLYSGGTTVDLGPATAAAYAINDSGEIIGASAAGDSFIYSNGKITNIALAARAISNNGKIVGSSGSHATLYNNGVYTDLGSFPGAVSTLAIGINIAGQIVGTAIFPKPCYCHPPKPGKHVALLFSSGAPVDLNTLIPSNSGFTITDAVGINDGGQIVCDATNASGHKHAVLLTPK